MRLNHKHILLSALVLALNGCSAVTTPAEKAELTMQELLIAKGKRDFSDQYRNVHQFNTMYVPQLTAEEASLPAWYISPASISVKDLSLDHVVAELVRDKDIRVEYRPGVVKQQKVTISGSHTSLGGYLEALAAATGYQVEAADKTIVFSKFVEKVFPIRTVSGMYDYAIGKRNEQASSSSNHSSQYATSEAVKSKGEEFGTVSGQYNPLEDFQAGVEIILGCKEESNSSQSMIQTNESTETLMQDVAFQLDQYKRCDSGAMVRTLESDNSILVRALPSQMSKVEKFVDEKTERELRQVRLDVTLVAIEVREDTALSLDLAIQDSVVGGSELGLQTNSNTAGSIIGGLGSLGNAVLTHTSGTQLALQALSEQGTILDKTILRGVAGNHRLTKITDVKKRSFISDRQLAQTADVGTTTSIEQEVVESGRVLYAFPNIGPSDVVVQISTSLSSLLALEPKGEGVNQVESPEISDRELNTVVRVKPGKPMLVGGFSVKELQTLRSLNGVSGITRSSTGTDVELVMVVEAVYL